MSSALNESLTNEEIFYLINWLLLIKINLTHVKRANTDQQAQSLFLYISSFGSMKFAQPTLERKWMDCADVHAFLGQCISHIHKIFF